MNALAYVLICCGSFSAASFGTPSAGELLANRIGAPIVNVAHAGKRFDQVAPSDEVIRNAALVVMADAFYWYTNFKEDCDKSVVDAERLFKARGNRPMILGTVPWNGGKCVNPVLKERCKDACILIEPYGDLEPPGMHPGKDYMEKLVRHVYAR